MLLNPFDDRSAGLSNVIIVTVLAGNLVDGVHGVRFRSGSFVGVEEGHQGGGGGEGCRDVVALECGLDVFVVTSRIGKEYNGRGRGLQLRRVLLLEVLQGAGHDEVDSSKGVTIG